MVAMVAMAAMDEAAAVEIEAAAVMLWRSCKSPEDS
jgi:hypothetical protein